MKTATEILDAAQRSNNGTAVDEVLQARENCPGNDGAALSSIRARLDDGTVEANVKGRLAESDLPEMRELFAV